MIGEVSNGSGVTTYLRGVTGLISQKKPDNTKLYYMTNGHGDVTALVNPSGSITKTYTYDAFGVEQNIDPADTNPFRYCGEYFDNETQSIYLRARYYNPGIGRFTQQDPAMADGMNWYVYCNGNPLNFVDPLGLARKLRDLVGETTGSVSWVGSNDWRPWVSKNTATVTIDGVTQEYNVVGDKVYVNGRQVGYMENDYIMVEEEDFNNDFNIVGTITIYAYYDPNDPNGRSYDGDITTGHSWIGYRPLGREETTYGTWPESPTTRKGLNINLPWERDNRDSEYTSKYSVKITQNQKNKMDGAIYNPDNDDWSIANNCTVFATKVMSAATGTIWAALTPYALKRGIDRNFK